MSRGHEIVNAPDLPEPIGFAHAVVAAAGRTVHLGGQIAVGPDGSLRGATMAEQFDVAAANVVTALAGAGGRPEHLVSLQVFVTDVPAYTSALGDIGAAYRRHFGRWFPAMALIGVHQLFVAGAMVELVGVAVVPAPGPDT